MRLPCYVTDPGSVDPLDDNQPWWNGVPTPGSGDYYVAPVADYGIHDGEHIQWAGDATRYFFAHLQSVDWQGYDGYADGQSNFYPGFQEDKFFAERNEPGGEIHNKVSLRITITPAVPEGINGHLNIKIFDPDNPLANAAFGSPDDGDPDEEFEGTGIESPNDNNGGLIQFAGQITIDYANRDDTNAGGGSPCYYDITGTLISSGYAGDNYIAAVGSSATEIGNFRFLDNEGRTLGYFQGGLDTWTNLSGNLQSREVTIWRTLWVEVDQMISPVAGDIIAGSVDDPLTPVEQPSTSLLASLLLPAKIVVQEMPSTWDTNDNMDFVQYLSGQFDEARGMRDVDSEKWFWTAHVVGAFDASRNLDNDPDDDDPDGNNDPQFLMGWSDHERATDGSNYLFYETIRDVHTQRVNNNVPTVNIETLKARGAAHEVLHRFVGWHTEGLAANIGIMGDANTVMDPLTDVSLRLIQIQEIQKKQRP